MSLHGHQMCHAEVMHCKMHRDWLLVTSLVPCLRASQPTPCRTYPLQCSVLPATLPCLLTATVKLSVKQDCYSVGCELAGTHPLTVRKRNVQLAKVTSLWQLGLPRRAHVELSVLNW